MIIESLIAQIEQLPEDWHTAGSVSGNVLRAIVKHAPSQPVQRSVETGAGKTTLLFSHLSQRHLVFAVDGGNQSITAVHESALFNPETVEFVEGPTQRTLSQYTFNQSLQVVLLDGPHGYPFPDIEYWHLYPHLAPGGLLIIDDLHIATIYNLFEFLREDAMFTLLEIVEKTAFFQRTDAPTFNPYGDGWWLQAYNKDRFPVEDFLPPSPPVPLAQKIKAWVPNFIKTPVKRLLGR